MKRECHAKGLFLDEPIPTLPENAITNAAAIATHHQRPAEEIAAEVYRLSQALQRYYETIDAHYRLHILPDGSWQIEAPYASKQGSLGDSEYDVLNKHYRPQKTVTFTIQPGEVALIKQIVTDPGSVPKPHSPLRPAE